ncbi:hypothetical protein GPJ56_005161 [Histomonas meleagridis]|uniref:uncharacterized protein n=1 Tax=Histomonas meleagridis TaxID=135588 RepID=UPI003559B4CE|nr:hypothetical protein GPJ56_005161 [Histomonas meleagridis]KAH0802677.1 hypothetical protein GO595_004726 [Histomonas meleagridis]
MQLQFKNNSTLKSTKKERKKAIFQESEGPPQVPKINQQICAENARGIYENIMTGNPEEIKTALLSFPFLFCNEITARCPTPEIVDIIFNFSLSQDSDVAYPALACICTIFETFPEVREFLFAREFYTQMPRFFNENDMLWHISILWDLDPRIMQYLISSGLIPFIIQNIQQSELDYFKQALELYTKLLNKEVPEAIEQVRELLLHLTFDQKSKKQVDSLNFLYAALPIVEEDLRNASFFDVFIPKILSFEANELSVAFSIVERISYFQEYAIYLYNKDIISIIHALFTMEEEFSQPNPRVRTAPDRTTSTSRLHLRQCNFWKYGKCNWGWSCRYLHGNTLADDPRRPEYRGPPVDFTQYPRPLPTSPRFNYSPGNFHADDASKMVALRNAVVEIVWTNETDRKFGKSTQELLLRNSIDVLQRDSHLVNPDQLNDMIEQKDSDFIIYIDNSVINIYPQGIAVQQSKLVDYIHRHWDEESNNLSPDQIELLTNSDIENITTKLTNTEHISSLIQDFQDKVSEALASMHSAENQIPKQKLEDYRYEFSVLFGKLNLANSTIADSIIYTPQERFKGTIVMNRPEPPKGISIYLQRTVSYFIAQSLTQVHLCLYHVNQMIGCLTTKGPMFAIPQSGSTCVHPSPFCFMECFSLLANEDRNGNDFAQRINAIEPDSGSVDVTPNYTLSFRYRGLGGGYMGGQYGQNGFYSNYL